MSRRILLLVLTSVLALVLGFYSFTPGQAVAIIKSAGYWIALAGLVTFIIVLVRSFRDVRPTLRDWRNWLGPVGLVLMATGFLHLHEGHEFKIVADEIVLQSTAKQMHFFREASTVVRGYDYAGNFTPLATYVDKRPLLFPLLLSTVHDFTGFRVQNVYFLNAVLSGVLMLVILLIGRRLDGWGAGMAAVLLVATIPLVAQNACGSGFEILNLVMVALTVWLGMRASEQPENDDRLGALVLSGVLLAQVRYESILFILPVAATVVYIWWRSGSVRLPWSLLVAPLLLVLGPLQLNVFKLSQAAWQLEDVAGAVRPFGLGYFYDNVGHALNFFLSFDGQQPSSVLVGVGGAIGLGFFVLLLYREHRTLFRADATRAVFSIFLVGLMLHTFVMLCYFWGKWDDLIIHRLSLPANLLLVFALVYIWPSLAPHRKRWVLLSSAAFVYLMAFTIPSNAMHRFTQSNYAARTANWLAKHIEAFGDRSVLCIDSNSGLLWLLHDKSSVTSLALANRPEGFVQHFKNRTFSEVLVVQRITPNVGTGEQIIGEPENFGAAFDLEVIDERAFAPLYVMRLSRIKAINEPALLAWAESRKALAPASTAGLTNGDSEQVLLWLRQLP